MSQQIEEEFPDALESSLQAEAALNESGHLRLVTPRPEVLRPGGESFDDFRVRAAVR